MDFKLPKEVSFIIDTLASHNFDAYIVGGCVRDTLLNKEPKDWDITTNALPEAITNIFQRTVPTGIKHGTVTVMINKNPYEVTTFRIDGSYTDSRHPDEVIFTTSLREDLSRRDFTVNAMAYNTKLGLKDPFKGKADLSNKLIKCVGDPNLRFNEDALRMLRAVRFSAQLNFEIDKNTLEAIAINNKLIKKVSLERIREELCKILLSDTPSKGMRVLNKTGLLEYILPELSRCIGFSQHNPHHDRDVFEHTLEVVDNTPISLTVRLAALFHDIGKPQCFSIDENGIGHFYLHHLESAKICEEILKRLKFDNNTIKIVCLLIKEHLSGRDSLKPAAVKRLISRLGVENLDNLLQLQIADIKEHKPPHDFTTIIKLKETIKEILESKQAFTIKQLAIKGSDLIAHGYPQGIIIGETLNKLLDLVVENPALNSREQLLKLAECNLNSESIK